MVNVRRETLVIFGNLWSSSAAGHVVVTSSPSQTLGTPQFANLVARGGSRGGPATKFFLVKEGGGAGPWRSRFGRVQVWVVGMQVWGVQVWGSRFAIVQVCVLGLGWCRFGGASLWGSIWVLVVRFVGVQVCGHPIEGQVLWYQMGGGASHLVLGTKLEN